MVHTSKLNTVLHLLSNTYLGLFNKYIQSISIRNETDIHIHISDDILKEFLIAVCLATGHKYKTLTDIIAVDYPYNKITRFQCIYVLTTIKYVNRILVKVNYKENQIIHSICSIFTCAEWYEREIWDLYGLWFHHHPNLRRILNDYGYRDFPFRKDYPLNGYVQVQYSSILNSVIINKLTSLQEFRIWDFQSPWVHETADTKSHLHSLDVTEPIQSNEELTSLYEDDIYEITRFIS